MSNTLQLHALTNPLTARPFYAPAIKLDTLQVIDCPEAFVAGAQESITGARPDYTFRNALQYLQRPSVAGLPRERQCEGMLELLACPIMQDVLDNPVVAADGYAYSSYAIKRTLNDGMKAARALDTTYVARSPLTGGPIENTRLIPNEAMRALLGELGVAAPQMPAHDETLIAAVQPEYEVPLFVPELPARTTVLTRLRPRQNPMERIEAIDRDLHHLSAEVGTATSLVQRAAAALKLRAVHRTMTQLLAAEPNNISLLRRGIDLSLIEGDLRGAQTLLNHAIAASPRHKDVLSRRALVAIGRNDTAQAWQALRELRELLPRGEDDLGRPAPMMGYDEMAEQRHMSWPARAAYGAILIREGSRTEGLRHLTQAQQLFSTRAVETLIRGAR